LDSRVTFTRASTGTYFDSAGVLQTAAINTPRFDYNPSTLAAQGLLIEEARTNLVLNSATLATQSVTVTAVAHTLSFYGTGTVVLSGAFVGTLVGSGAFPTRSTLTFTPTAGTLTLTVTGSVTQAQLETGAFATSYIPTTSAAATRAADLAAINTLSPWYNATEGTLFAQFKAVGATLATQQGIWGLDDGTTNNVIYGARAATTNRFRYNSRSGGVVDVDGQITTPVITDGAVAKTVVAIATNNYNFALDGSAGTADTSAVVPTVNRLTLGNYIFSGSINGYLQRITYYPRRLTNAELRTLTA
jgi:hypothetical protein